MTIGAFVLLAFVLGIVAYDWVSLRGKNRRAVLLEVGAFLVERCSSRSPIAQPRSHTQWASAEAWTFSCIRSSSG